MNSVLIYGLISTFIVSILSFTGIFFLAVKDKILRKLLLSLVGFSAGALIGGAFLHLMLEVLEETKEFFNPFIYLIIGIIIFYLLERILKWHHCHEGKCDVHTFTYMNLVGDGIHNFIDGLVIVSAFSINTGLGVITTLMIIGHEVPQEIGDFGVLVYGGFSKIKALLWNFASAATAILGAIVGFFLGNSIEGFNIFLLPFAAGGFVYIAMSDLIPELHKEPKLGKSLTHFGFFCIGLALMYFIKVYFRG